MTAQDFGNSGEFLEFDPGDAIICFPIGSEHPWNNRNGRVVARDFVKNLVTLRFDAVFYEVQIDDGTEIHWKCTDDFAGNVTRERVAATEPAAGPWIPVTERMPEERLLVLVCAGNEFSIARHWVWRVVRGI